MLDTEITYSKTFTLTENDVQNIFVTAMEGGIDYWATMMVYDWPKIQGEIVNEDTGKRHDVNAITVIDGVEYVASRVGQDWYAGPLIERIANNDYDASDADIIIQAGLFGKVVYG